MPTWDDHVVLFVLQECLLQKSNETKVVFSDFVYIFLHESDGDALYR